MNVIETLLTLVIWGAFSIVVLNRVDRELKISTPRTPPGLVAHMLCPGRNVFGITPLTSDGI